jgi:hypothetical protein
MKWTSWLAGAVLVTIMGFVVWSSFHAGEVCIQFRSRQACRAVDGANEEEARTAARTNACAFLASGVTDTMACERTPPLSSTCRTP